MDEEKMREQSREYEKRLSSTLNRFACCHTRKTFKSEGVRQMRYIYEAVWFEGSNEESAMQGDPYMKEFSTKRSLFEYVRAHANDSFKYGWWLTKRDSLYWDIVEEYDLSDALKK